VVGERLDRLISTFREFPKRRNVQDPPGALQKLPARLGAFRIISQAVNLPTDAEIAAEKLTSYLLVKRPVGDKGEVTMKFKLFEQVALAKDIPEKKLRRGDVATVVDNHPGRGGEVGYSIEVFNAVGDTIAVTAVPESFLEELTPNEILHVRSLAG